MSGTQAPISKLLHATTSAFHRAAISRARSAERFATINREMPRSLQMLYYLFAYSSRSQNQRASVWKFSENLLRKFHSRRTPPKPDAFRFPFPRELVCQPPAPPETSGSTPAPSRRIQMRPDMRRVPGREFPLRPTTWNPVPPPRETHGVLRPHRDGDTNFPSSAAGSSSCSAAKYRSNSAIVSAAFPSARHKLHCDCTWKAPAFPLSTPRERNSAAARRAFSGTERHALAQLHRSSAVIHAEENYIHSPAIVPCVSFSYSHLSKTCDTVTNKYSRCCN